MIKSGIKLNYGATAKTFGLRLPIRLQTGFMQVGFGIMWGRSGTPAFSGILKITPRVAQKRGQATSAVRASERAEAPRQGALEHHHLARATSVASFPRMAPPSRNAAPKRGRAEGRAEWGNRQKPASRRKRSDPRPTSNKPQTVVKYRMSESTK